MTPTRSAYVAATFLFVILALSAAQFALQSAVSAQAGGGAQAPMFQVDAMWPRPLPNKWVIGSTIGVAVDARDHVWVLHRPATLSDNEKAAALIPPRGDCCIPAPPVLEFDQVGNIVSSWGGPGTGYEWPDSEHGIFVDHKDNVWIAGNGEKDSQVLKFTRQGKFLLQIGRKGMKAGSNDTQNLWRPADVEVDPTTNEAYVADGYGNKRVIVFDADTGAYRRHWGAYGNKPDDADLGTYRPEVAAQQFRNPVHCVAIARDGLVYVCDRQGNRIQVFQKNGKFVKEAFIARNTLGSGAVWDLGFSVDAQQRFLYNPDGQSNRVFVILRDPLQVVSTFGTGGRYPGQFYGAHNVAVDSKGNIYTVETYEGKRVQRFIYKGLGARSSGD